jgi:hypothetical protein
MWHWRQGWSFGIRGYVSEGGEAVVGAGGVGDEDEGMEMERVDRGAVGLEEERRGRSGILRVSFRRVLGAGSTAIFIVSGVVSMICRCTVCWAV